MQEVESTLIAKPKTKSAVWNFFLVESDSDDSNTSKPICCKCFKPVAASYGNTSNLFNHLCRKHPLVYAQVHDKKKCKKKCSKALSSKGSDQQTIEHAFSLGQKYDRKGKKWQQLMDKVTRCIVKYILPISIVEKPGFKQMLESFDPRYQLPSIKHFSKIAIPALFNSTQSTLASILHEVKIFAVLQTCGPVCVCNHISVILYIT